MNIVIPMAGRGSRFKDVGIDTPKPLIPVRGVPMYVWAMRSLPLELATRVIFICLQEHLEELALRNDIMTRYADFDPVIVSVDQVTEGQACTVLLAREHINDETPLVIYNADTYCRSRLADGINSRPDADGFMTVFEAEGEKWSFARTDDSGRIIETAEKKRISSLASTGLYHFSKGSDFIRYADEMIAENDRVNNEFYVAPVYNRMLDAQMNLYPDHAEEVWVLGTPEDLAYFEANYKNIEN